MGGLHARVVTECIIINMSTGGKDTGLRDFLLRMFFLCLPLGH